MCLRPARRDVPAPLWCPHTPRPGPVSVAALLRTTRDQGQSRSWESLERDQAPPRHCRTDHLVLEQSRLSTLHVPVPACRTGTC